MKSQYLADKANRKKSTREAMWLLFIFIVVFMAVIVRVAVRY